MLCHNSIPFAGCVLQYALQGMAKDSDENNNKDDGADWAYDGERSRFRQTVERIES